MYFFYVILIILFQLIFKYHCLNTIVCMCMYVYIYIYIEIYNSTGYFEPVSSCLIFLFERYYSLVLIKTGCCDVSPVLGTSVPVSVGRRYISVTSPLGNWRL